MPLGVQNTNLVFSTLSFKFLAFIRKNELFIF
jgi:hypothetical protein